MTPTPALLRSLALTLVLCFQGEAALAQAAPAPAKDYQPSEGQAGKDVVWVPTPQVLVDKMLDMAKVTANDYVIDLGSGDGRTVITAAKRGARSLGIEYEPKMVELSRANAKRERVAARAEFVKADLFDADLSRASVITMFLLPTINAKLMPKILGLKPGTRVVSNTFPMGDWEPDEKVTLDHRDGCESAYCTALLWIVPAQAGGTHKTALGELTLKQQYQMVSGELRTDGKTVPVAGKVVGQQLLLTADGRELRGRVNGGRIELR